MFVRVTHGDMACVTQVMLRGGPCDHVSPIQRMSLVTCHPTWSLIGYNKVLLKCWPLETSEVVTGTLVTYKNIQLNQIIAWRKPLFAYRTLNILIYLPSKDFAKQTHNKTYKEHWSLKPSIFINSGFKISFCIISNEVRPRKYVYFFYCGLYNKWIQSFWASLKLEMFYLKTIEQLFLFVELLDKLKVCLPYSRL